VTNFVAVAVTFMKQVGVLSCVGVTWSGMFCLNLNAGLSMIQSWAMQVKADRAMRQRFSSTIRPKAAMIFCSVIGIYNIILITVFSSFDDRQKNEKECPFLIPWSMHIPFILIVFCCRVLTNQLTKRTAVEEKVSDYLGISIESTAMTVFMTCLLVLYMRLAWMCTEGTETRYCFLSDYCFIFIWLGHSLIGMGVPVLRVFISRLKVAKIKTAKNQRIYVSPLGKQQSLRAQTTFTIFDILNDHQNASKFRNHAKKMLCAENVDFLIEVLKYKKDVESLFIVQHVTRVQIQTIHEELIAVINEFVIDEAPSEVNLSCDQKKEVVQFKDFDLFARLSQTGMYHILDQAQKEIEKLLCVNILCSFLAIQDRENLSGPLR